MGFVVLLMQFPTPFPKCFRFSCSLSLWKIWYYLRFTSICLTNCLGCINWIFAWIALIVEHRLGWGQHFWSHFTWSIKVSNRHINQQIQIGTSFCMEIFSGIYRKNRLTWFIVWFNEERERGIDSISSAYKLRPIKKSIVSNGFSLM